MYKLVITKRNSFVFSVVFDESDGPVEVYAEPIDAPSRLDNIYLGHVTNIVKNIDAAFIEIEGGCTCYCSLKEKTSYLFGPHANDERLCMGDYVLVQVRREDIKTKQPSVTGKLQLAGKYLVLLHDTKGVKISHKVKNKEEINRLKTLFSNCENGNYGLIVRTNALQASDARLKEEEERLAALYKTICETGIHKTKGSLVYQSFPWYIDLLRDVPSQELSEVITDDAALFSKISEYARQFQPEDMSKLRLYTDESLSLSALYSLQKVEKEALSKTVWLKSGASLIIEPTETMTVIDVNTGKAINGKKAGDEMFYKINEEAAAACMKQIRLRNLSGMILIDFINMEKEEYNERLMQLLKKLAEKDRIPVTVVDMTGLKLVELTRKKVKKPLHEALLSIS
ncbi:MAG: ribonuclease E/G [Lachnospiraceae bacterium]|nr:ribonuclease E/G [Lachnospiraceae bacterium]